MILIEPDASFPRAALPKRELSRFLADACDRIGLMGEVTVMLSTDAHVQELNRTYRRKNKPTDVLSFPAAPPAFAGAEVTAGDLAISIDTAGRQAEALGHSLKFEVQILMLHGLLHLAGFDHEQDTGQMGRRESKLRRHYGLPAGLIQRAGLAESAAVKDWFSRPESTSVVRRQKRKGPPAKSGSRTKQVEASEATTTASRAARRTVAVRGATPAAEVSAKKQTAARKTLGRKTLATKKVATKTLPTKTLPTKILAPRTFVTKTLVTKTVVTKTVAGKSRAGRSAAATAKPVPGKRSR